MEISRSFLHTLLHIILAPLGQSDARVMSHAFFVFLMRRITRLVSSVTLDSAPTESRHAVGLAPASSLFSLCTRAQERGVPPAARKLRLYIWVVFSSDTTGFLHPHVSLGSTITHCINAYKGDSHEVKCKCSL